MRGRTRKKAYFLGLHLTLNFSWCRNPSLLAYPGRTRLPQSAGSLSSLPSFSLVCVYIQTSGAGVKVVFSLRNLPHSQALDQLAWEADLAIFLTFCFLILKLWAPGQKPGAALPAASRHWRGHLSQGPLSITSGVGSLLLLFPSSYRQWLPIN